MESLIIGFITAVLTFAFSTSYLSSSGKRRLNRVTGNSFTDIAITVGCLLLAGTATSSLMTVLGLGVGASIAIRISKLLWGTGK